MNHVFVLDNDKRPLTPCQPGQARRLLKSGQAAVWRTMPFTIILKVAMPDAIVKPLTVKIDPGSKLYHIPQSQKSHDKAARFNSSLRQGIKEILFKEDRALNLRPIDCLR